MKKIMLVLGIVFAGYISYALVEMTDRLVSLQTVLDTGLFIAMVTCFIGLWRFKRWALRLSWVLAAAALVWGCYLVYFVWTFRLFAAPTLMERIVNVLRPARFLECLQNGSLVGRWLPESLHDASAEREHLRFEIPSRHFSSAWGIGR